MTLPAFVDAEGIVKDWLNTRTAMLDDLTGGAHVTRRRSAAGGPWALLSRITGDDLALNEAPSDRVRISASIFAMTKDAAAKAAVAYANELRRIAVERPIIGAHQLRAVEDIRGPQLITESNDDAQYLVDATVLIIPA